ncbi:MAG: 2-C-methyl-D-erythritol 2,4-cyclodiphosphate synthase [bacterium]
MSIRVGMGYDVHRVQAGRPLVLGGVRFESDWGLEGHSDADVLAHAVGDALLGAAALGDLGQHFPPGSKKWKDVSSLHLLELIAGLLAKAGARVGNVDVMMVAEAPKIAPHREAMCANIAKALGVDAKRSSIKATTNETLGAIGRHEGLAAMAVALVEME